MTLTIMSKLFCKYLLKTIKTSNLPRFIVSLIILSVQYSLTVHSEYTWTVSSLVQSLSFNFVQLLV